MTSSAAISAFLSDLKTHLPPEAYSTDQRDRTLMSQDIWARGETSEVIVSPRSVEDLQSIVKAAAQHGIALNPRGGGLSYTKGYTPDRANVASLDLRFLDNIVAINTDDMFVTVQAGVTWKSLYEALKPLGVRTPFWGPLSGISSTVGGGLSQNNAFFGASSHGTTGDSVLSVAVVLADGTLLRTGTAGTPGTKPFFRHYGPDLTGIFCGDAGALGIKAEITFRLIPLPEAEDWASFEFRNQDDCARAMAAIGRTGVACELFGFDPNLTNVRLKRASLLADAKALKNVIAGQKSLLRGLKEGAKVALAGRKFIESDAWSLHFVVEDSTPAAVREKIAGLKQMCRDLGGHEVENTIPKVIRSTPFTPPNNIVGPDGERWVPVHGIVPMSDGPKVWREIATAFDDMADALSRHDVTTGFLITTIGTSGYLIEPVFLWPEQLDDVHHHMVEQNYLKKLRRRPSNPDATALVQQARARVIDIFSRSGAAHFQIGRTYPYFETRDDATKTVLRGLKALLDPSGRINPGALGLAPPDTPTPIPVRNPRTGNTDFELSPATDTDVAALASHQRRAAERWQTKTLEDRCRALNAFATALNAHRSAIAAALEQDTGRRRIAGMEVDGVIASIAGWTQAAPRLLDTSWIQGRSNPHLQHTAQFVPYTLVGVISPWNFPMTLSMIDTVPALLAGCTVMIKPSEVTPRFAEPLRAAIDEAGLSDILKIVQGGGATGASVIRHTDLVCFTGSVATGKKVAKAAAEAMIPAFLELGGKDPLIVLDDADLDKATDAALRGSVLSTGQACQSIERIYVAASIHDEFVRRLVAKAKAVELNWPDITHGHIGPIIFDRQAEILQRHINDAVALGATLHTGGKVEHLDGGLWLRPTVLTDVSHDMAVMREETFGPIMPIMAFGNDEDAIQLANDTEFGLSAAVFSGSLARAEAVGRQLNAGAISLNDAALTSLFHEAEKNSFKMSGMGPSRTGVAGFQRFLRRKALIANHGAPAPIEAFAEHRS